jgi:hypothetical protein
MHSIVSEQNPDMRFFLVVVFRARARFQLDRKQAKSFAGFLL